MLMYLVGTEDQSLSTPRALSPLTPNCSIPAINDDNDTALEIGLGESVTQAISIGGRRQFPLVVVCSQAHDKPLAKVIPRMQKG